jgi:Protein of unknown function (DUF1579)
MASYAVKYMTWAVVIVMGAALGARPELAGAEPPSAAARMSVPGAEGKLLATDAGSWEVVATLRPTADAKPMVTRGLVAERTLIGLYLQEVMKPGANSSEPEFQRIDYLTYNRVEGRWQYVSMDTRLPVGIMPAYSFDKGELQFEPIAFVGLGHNVEGMMVRSNMVITRDGNAHQTKEQYWSMADGSGRTWLAVQYDYRRKPAH